MAHYWISLSRWTASVVPAQALAWPAADCDALLAIRTHLKDSDHE